MKNQKSVAIGTVVGGVVGATATLLTAPKSGEKLREDISNQLTEGTIKTEKLANELKDKMSELSDMLNESSSNVSQTFKQKSEAIINEAKQIINNNEPRGKENVKIIVRDILKEEMNASTEFKQIVEQEIKEIEEKLNKDINELKETVKH
ncbi:YtxH domain-containing protein [Alkalihalobacillus deserti]|uniref:YtxH domain-containing protein n=1 Tax=Alkalihalobacillus deserti TaxID=2879466 RepID=UPI001D1530F5|nr:YtxH domain-containing protein [Alkalihalobacillus deserti]